MLLYLSRLKKTGVIVLLLVLSYYSNLISQEADSNFIDSDRNYRSCPYIIITGELLVVNFDIK